MFSCKKNTFNACHSGPQGPPGPVGPPYDGSGNLDLSCNAIVDVSNIDFCQNIVMTVSPNPTGNIAIGNNAGYSSTNTIAIGHNAGQSGQETDTIAIGREAGNQDQSANSIAIGFKAGQINQGFSNNNNFQGQSVAIGQRAGRQNQAGRGIAIGLATAEFDQSSNAVAIGLLTGYQNQGRDSIALGTTAGFGNQKKNAIAIGNNAGQIEQGECAIAIGQRAGNLNQGDYAIAIGQQAGWGSTPLGLQHANTIVLNALATPLSTDGTDRFYVKPIRNNSTTQGLFYDTTTGEITYEAAGGGGGGGAAWDPSFNYYFMRKPWPPVYITDGSFSPPLTYGRGTFDASSGKYDPVDQRIELNWVLPPREAAAFNFNVIPHQLNNGTVNLTNSGAPNANQEINDICLNYLPYHETLNIDIRESNAGVVGSWATLAPSDITLPGIPPKPNLYSQTRGAYFVAGTGTSTGIYGPIIPAPAVPKFVYQNTNFLQLGSKQYQFRIYLKNKSEEVLPSPDYWGTVNPEWNYLYMPDASDAFFVFGSFGPATPPQLINISSTDYKLLNITGANNFPNLSNPYADQSLNTPFPSLYLYNLHVNYGFDLSGSISPTSLQFQIPPTPYTNFDISYVSNNIVSNNWLFNQVGNNFSPSAAQNLASTGNQIIFPGYQYDISGYFMKINSDLSYNVYTTKYLTPTTIPPFIPYPSVVVSPPTRNDVTTTNIYENFLSGNFFIDSNLIKVAGTDASLATVAYYTGVLTPPLSNVYFFGPTSEYRLNNSVLNYKVADARTSLVGEYPNDLGTALVGQNLCFFQFSTNATVPQDLTGTMRVGYTGNDLAVIETNNYFQFNQSESRDALTATLPPETYRLRGWYAGVEIGNLFVKDITLTSYPDICNNSFSAWDISFGQYFANGAAASPPLNYKLSIAKHPLTDIVLNGFSETHTNPTTTINFFGLKRPSVNPVFISTLSGTFTDMNIWWRPSNTLMTGELKYALSNSGGSGNFIDNYSISWPYTPQQPASYNIPSTTVQLDLSTITTPTFTYSRDRNFTPQFYIDGTHSNNITYPTPITPSPSTLDISFNNKQLWWDFTTLNPTLPFSYTLHAPGTGEYPTNYSPGYTSAYSHGNLISDSQLMWCKTGFTAGGYPTTSSVNPYIDYRVYYDQTVDYSSKNTTGISKNLTYTVTNDDYYEGGTKTITGTYKWILLSDTRVSSSSFGKVVVNGSGGTANPLKLGDDYLLYIQEIDQYFVPSVSIPSGYAAGRSGWKAVQGTWNQGVTVQLNNADEAGAYRRNTPSGAVALNYIKFYNPNPNSTIFYRIGIQNSSNIKISDVTISYGTN